MKCYYEVLQVDTHANDDEIKKSYRKLALMWHPDKNLENSDEAKDQFQLIQQAYEVLSDPQERAFYDKHKDSILRGGFDSDYQDESLNVFEYFTTSCFKGFGEDAKSFYSVYNEVFKKISAEDSEFDKDFDSDFEVPVFGNSQSSYRDIVHPFYAHWESYSTKKTYSWLDEYDIRQASNRKVVKLMEKENKKIRDKAKKERNEEVRALVRFVRKRDKRVQAHAEFLKEKAMENEEKAKEERRKQILLRKTEMEAYVESDWSKFSNLERELEEIEAKVAEEFQDDSDVEQSVIGNDPLYCIACDKLFKSEKAFSNHENSKKHKENVQSINDMMQEEDKLFREAGNNVGSSSGQYNVDATLPNDNDIDLEIAKKVSQLQNKRRKKCISELKIKNGGGLSGDLNDEDELASSNSFKQNGNNSTSAIDCKASNDYQSDKKSVVVDGENQRSFEKSIVSSNSSEDELTLEIIECQRRTKKHRDDVHWENINARKKKSKRRNREEASATAESVTSVTAPEKTPPSDSAEILCGTCKQIFNSKNALFKHLKSIGHAIPPKAETMPEIRKFHTTNSKKKGKLQKK
ncbi:unnamed protein product [Nesidiocoris tenuis]|uniref:Uncharacterized protein n=2 Tax=Nesidiocoris tenuis TaxID=355587 RepID=A0A6H5HB19_9HEMI|nr:Zinc-finger double-stranded RNA-Hypothetical protein [Nesidiocoris tenuis]CAB0014316.1 unnamed protein product [Nesidiocoris tenuis]